MRLADDQKTLIRESFGRVAPGADAAGKLFYGRLFEVAPQVRDLFHGDVAEQGLRLMQAIAYAVLSLDRMEELLAAAEELGRRHARYGVRDEHYSAFWAALLWTLEERLGPAFTPEVREAWGAFYDLFATTMKRGAAS
jgi:nitric oxide dioxygenase